MAIDIETIGIGMDTSGLVKGQAALKSTEQAANRTADAADKLGTRGARGFGQYSDAAAMAERQTKALADASTTFSRIMSTALVGFGASAVISQIDAYTKFTAQLKLASTSASEYARSLDDVRRIAKDAQSDLSATGVLYARIANGTRELGIGQKAVADITETVNLALKVSGATAQESASAMLQLSQSFASGTLRGEEFNAVNEAAPRLMTALADGMGVPIGALKQMASDGLITSEVMSRALPKALGELREEAKSVQTISGAFTGLKNNMLEFTGTQAQANGTVKLITGSINLLSNNLTLLSGVLATVTAVKFATWLEAIVTNTLGAVAANRALVAANIATAQAQVSATASAATLTAARVAELRAAVLASQGNVALAITTNGLIPAQARAAAAAEAHAVALGTLTIAQRAASISGAAATGAMALLGGPIGLITAALGIGATAWMLWGRSSDDANKQAASAMESSSREILANLDKQNAKLKERLALANAGSPDAAKAGGVEAERMASTLTKINELKAKGNSLTGAEQIALIEQQGIYDDLRKGLETKSALQTELDKTGSAATDLIEVRQRLAGVNKSYLEDLKKLETAFKKGVISEKDYVATVSELAKKTYDSSKNGKKGKDTDSDFKTYLSNLEKQIQKTGELSAVEKLLDDIRRKSLTVTTGQQERLMLLAREVDLTKEAIRISDERAAQRKKDYEDSANGIREIEAADRARLKALTDSGPAAQLEKQRKEMLFLAEAFEKGRISAEEFSDAATGYLNLGVAQKELTQMEQFTKRAAENIQDSIGSGLYDIMQGNFKNIGNSFKQMLDRMVAEAIAADISRKLFGSLVQGGSGGGLLGSAVSAIGGLLGGDGGSYNMWGGATGAQNSAIYSAVIGSAKGNVFNSPGLSAYSGQIVSSPTLFPFAKGVGLMGEAGPEAIMPLKRGADGKLGVSSGGGRPMVINNNFTLSGPVSRDSQRQIAAMAGDSVRGAQRIR